MALLRGAANSPVGSTTSRSTTALNKVGVKFYDSDGNEYIYVKAEGVVAAYAPMSLSNGLGEAASSADAKGFFAIAQAAFADEEYGFALFRGRGLALVPSGTSIGDPLTAGNGALSATLTNATRHVTAQEASPLLSGTTQAKYVWLH